MRAGVEVVLKENLRALNLSDTVHNLEAYVRQAKEAGVDYEEFLLTVTEGELQGRRENRLKRRLKEAKFALMKPLEMFDLEAAPGLDHRLIRELAEGEFIHQHRNIIFLGKSGTGNYRKFLFMERFPEKGARFGYLLMKIFP